MTCVVVKLYHSQLCSSLLVYIRQANGTQLHFPDFIVQSIRVLSPAVYYDSMIDSTSYWLVLHQSICRLLCLITAQATNTEIADCSGVVAHRRSRVTKHKCIYSRSTVNETAGSLYLLGSWTWASSLPSSLFFQSLLRLCILYIVTSCLSGAKLLEYQSPFANCDEHVQTKTRPCLKKEINNKIHITAST